MAGRKIFIDFETRSHADLKKCGVDVYLKHHSTEILCVGVGIDKGPVKVFPSYNLIQFEKLLFPIAQADTLIGHNARFEMGIFEHLLPRYLSFKKIPPSQWECTMVMAYAMGLPGSLEGACASVGIEDAKDLKGQRIMLQLAKPKKGGEYYDLHTHKEKYEKLYAYCEKDVEAERQLYARLRPFSDAEKKVWELDYKINERGIKVDIKKARLAYAISEIKKEELDSKMNELTKGYVPTCSSNAALLDWLKSRGIELSSVDKSSVIGHLNTKNLDETVRKVLLLRKEAAKTSTAKLKAMIESASEDSRIRGTLQYHASHTGRWGGRKIQPQNFPRGSFNESEIEAFFEMLGRETEYGN